MTALFSKLLRRGNSRVDPGSRRRTDRSLSFCDKLSEPFVFYHTYIPDYSEKSLNFAP